MNTLSLNPKLFDADVEQLPIRKGFGEGLLQAGVEDHNVVGMCADLTESTQMHLFAKQFPDRYVQGGIAEQSMASVASGMAAMGKIPFFSSYSAFSPGRNWEQIRTTICYNDVNAKVVGSHAGISVGPDGGTHQAIEDIAITRVIPRMTVIVPCDAIEAKKATLAAAKFVGPVYIRLGRENTPVLTTLDTPFSIGKAEVYFRPREGMTPVVGIIATGVMVSYALRVAKKLEEEGVGVAVMNLATIKPLDTESVLAFAKECGKILTVEEHQKRGGLGSVIAEFLAENHPVPMSLVGIDDQFGQSGTPDELYHHYGIDTEGILKKTKELVQRT